MQKLLFFTLLSALLLTIGCQDEQRFKSGPNGHSNDELRMKDDSTIYGLACEGCTDSVIVLLPNDGSDPVKYDIIDATRNHKVLGKIKTGDWIGLVLNKQDKKVADLVVDLDQLKGIWCYIVMPKMRDYDKMSKKLQSRLMRNMPDSLKQTFLIPREYGFWLKRQWEASSVGYVQQVSTLADESPVVYPPLGYFVKWNIWNGKFVMTSGKPKYNNENKVVGYTDVSYDTCSIDYLDEDSLVLSDRDGSRSYYRKNDIKEVNKRAQAIASRISKEALKKSAEQ
ncbi:MAG: hypothetical protein I3J02_09535 [Prevotella sp.]|nr:hypothetical protein [Prevotella sp.]